MVVQHNISAMTANRYYGVNNKGLAGSLEKLASGYAINKAGDNAAGLAVSEKMRAQIGGLTQASKNAEDGISLVQTMEGALQETDSILQRMRTLAVQSANGSYQDDVDREAMQLEFDQLNDELNQIADTDFNGTVMLNGGQMADGLKADANGKIDYANNSRVKKQLSASEINSLDYSHMDDALATGGSDSTHSRADALWKTFGFDRNDANVDNEGPDEVTVTFQYDSTSQTWSAIDATGGAAYSGIKTNTNANNGGFQVGSAEATGDLNDSAGIGANNGIVNVVLDGTTLVNGDTIAVTFKNPSVKNTAIENIGVSSVDTSNFTVGAPSSAGKKVVGEDVNLDVTINNAVIESTNNGQTTEMTQGTKALFDALNGATVTTTFVATDSAKPDTNGYGITFSDSNFGTVSGADLVTGKKLTSNGEDFFVKATAADGIKIYKGATASGDLLVTLKSAAAGDEATTGSTGTISYQLAVDTSKFDKSATPTAEIATPDGKVSTSNAFNQSKATMTYTDHLGLQVGARTKDLVDFTFNYKSNGLGDLKANLNCSSRTDGLGTADLSIADQKSANAAIDKIDNALNKVNMVRATFGAAQNRIEHKISNIDTNTENLTAAESRIRDTQMDKEMMKFTSSQILSQASQSMLAQANQLPQGVLQLLG